MFAGFAGNDLIDGRGGFDRADYNVDATTLSGITVNLAAGTVTGDATVGTDTLRSIEAVRGTNLVDSYNAAGFSGNSTNAGSLGTFNEFTGNGGDDFITGNDNTRLGFNNATGGVNVDFVTGIASGDASVGIDHFTGVNAVQASMFDDTLLGGSTNDTFTGLAGNDLIDGRNGFDTASYNNIFFTTGGVTVNMAAGTVTGDVSIGTDTLRSIEGVQGTMFADTYNAIGYGNGQPATLNIGNNGNFNQFEGLGGDDSITGNGDTRVIYSNSTAGVTVTMGAGGSGSASGNDSVGQDTFVSGVNAVRGSEFNDIITGNGGNNTLEGQGGSDTLRGFAGDDTLIGGTGADTFVYDRLGTGGTGHGTGNGGIDTITDFHGHNSEGDRIDLRSLTNLTNFNQITNNAVQNGADAIITFGQDDTTMLVLRAVDWTTLTANDFILFS